MGCGVAFLPGDEDRVVSGSVDHDLRLWSLSSGACLRVLKGHTDEVTGVALSGGGQATSVTMVSCSVDKSLRVWDPEHDGPCIRVLQGHTDRVSGVAVNQEGTLAVSSSWDYTVQAWDLRAGSCRRL